MIDDIGIVFCSVETAKTLLETKATNNLHLQFQMGDAVSIGSIACKNQIPHHRVPNMSVGQYHTAVASVGVLHLVLVLLLAYMYSALFTGR